MPQLSIRAARRCLAAISDAKNQLLSHDADANTLNESIDDQITVAAAYKAYQSALKAANAVDFDDLLLVTVQLLEEQPDVRNALQQRLRWISVDEYQDVNLAQVRLLRLLASAETNLCVIGDPDQAIYGFRGSDQRYFFSFQDDYPNARTIQLEQNYRSTQMILEAAQQVIARNPDRNAAVIWSEFAQQAKLDIHHAPTDRAEAEYVVHQIEQMVGGTSYFSIDSGRVDGERQSAPDQDRSFGDFAVLYRTRAQCRALVEAFERSGIPYQTGGEKPLTAHEEIRRIVALLRQHIGEQSLQQPISTHIEASAQQIESKRRVPLTRPHVHASTS